MRLFSPAALITILLMSAGCSSQSTDESREQASPIRFSNTYKAPEFQDKDRIQKIREALRESHSYYMEPAYHDSRLSGRQSLGRSFPGYER